MDMAPEERRIQQTALEFARRNKAIARRLACREKFPPEEDPVSVFMAGSPGQVRQKPP